MCVGVLDAAVGVLRCGALLPGCFWVSKNLHDWNVVAVWFYA